MLRSLGKTVFACAYTWSGAGRMLSARTEMDPCVMPFIVAYHRVVENFDRSARHSIPSMLTSKAMLERHMDWLAKRFRLASLDEIGLHLECGRSFRKPTAAITFDDGYSDVYYNAYPMLKRKGIPAAVFVVTDLIGTKNMQIYDKLYLLLSRLKYGKYGVRPLVAEFPHLGKFGLGNSATRGLTPYRIMTELLNRFPRSEVDRITADLEQRVSVERNVSEEMLPLTWDTIAEMQRAGITVGSHTKTHTLLTQEPLERAHREITESKRALETRLNAPVEHFAYPDGRFNTAVLQAVQSAGYRYGYGICRSRDPGFPLLTIPRKVLWERACLGALGQFSPAIMNCQAHWAFARRRCEHDHAAGSHGRMC